MKASQAILLALTVGIPAAVFADDGGGMPNCTGTVVVACGMKIVKSVCTVAGKTDDDIDEDYEHHGSDDGHSARTQSPDIDESDGTNTYRNDDGIPPSTYPGKLQSYDFSYTDPRGKVHAVDHSQRMGTSPDGRLTICHRMGGARITLDVPDDQINGVKAHGHGNHEMDTLGRCEEQEDASGNDDPAKISAAKKLSGNPLVSASTAACLSAPPGTNLTVSLPDGTSWTGPAPGCNVSGVSCNVPFGASAGSSPAFTAEPNRAGVRTLH